MTRKSKAKAQPATFSDQLAWQLRESRLVRGLKQTAVAKDAGMHVQSLSRIERGLQTNICVNTLVRIGEALGTDPSNLVSLAYISWRNNHARPE